MTNQAFLLRYFPGLILIGLLGLAYLLGFNGLYGQDAHEYLRQSQSIFENWASVGGKPQGLGASEFGIGYPVAGALFRFVTGDAVLALQLVSSLSMALSAFLLLRILGVLSQGSRADSRLIFTVLGLVLAPLMLRSGLLVMSDSLGLCFCLAAFFYGLRWIEQSRGADTVKAAVFIVLAVSVRLGLAGLLLPLTCIIGWFLLLRGHWCWLLLALLTGLLCLFPHFLLEQSVLVNPLGHSNVHWSPAHLFQRSFQFDNGHARYLLPNIVYLGFPLMHPGFCLLLPGVFLLVKKTDFRLPAKKAILVCIAFYLLLLGGLPHQNLRFLLPVYALVLLLLFPAWDRLYCYGLIFFKRITLGVLALLLVLQLFFSVRIMLPTLARNRLEQEVAASLKSYLPPQATVYSFDLDIALKSYLPEVQFVNLWVQRYDHFPKGAYVLFNAPALQAQWDGLNPMLNWDFMVENFQLDEICPLPEGWTLYVLK